MKQFWYIEPKEGQKYANIGCSGWNEANSRIEFDELVFIKDDDFYHVFAYATAFTEIQNFNNKSWKFEPQLVKFRVARKDYQKEDRDKNKVDVKQSRLEKWLCSLFQESEEGLVYRGWINLKDDSYCDLFVTKELKGIPIDDVVLKQMMAMSLEWELLTEPPTKINLEEDIKLPNGKGGYGKEYAKTQTESQKLSDRVKFVCEQFTLATEEPITNLNEIRLLLADDKKRGMAVSLLEICSALIK